MITSIAFIGAGNMASAILRGILSARLLPASAVSVADPVPDRLAPLPSLYPGIRTTPDNAAAASSASLVLLAVKPQQLREALAPLALSPSQLLVSICAGVPTALLESLVPARVVRVMPNLPATVSAGYAALAAGSRATPADLEDALALFRSVGDATVLPENLLDAVTAISGSGPGYVFAFIEALESAAIALGIPPESARPMAIATVRGAAELAAASSEDPATLRRRVSSPGGTTLAGLERLQNLPAELLAAATAARDRSVELSRP